MYARLKKGSGRVAFFFLCLQPHILLAKALVKAKQDHVKVYAAANKTAPVVQELQKGSSLAAHTRTGMFWEVETASGKLGYVSVLTVQFEADGKSSEGLSSALHDAIQKSREEDEGGQVRARSSVMGVRGLDESKDTEFAGSIRPNLRLVYEMEDRIVAPAKITHLAQEVATEIENRMKAPPTSAPNSHP